MKYNIIQGDNRETLKTLADNSVDAVVTDPPYGIDFLGKDWDANTGALETYRECLRVLKPGGYILAFSAARTYHHLAVTLEQAGFEIRDQLMWLYASGFPKAQDIGKAIQKRLGVEEYEEIIQPKNEGMGTAYNDKAYRYDEDNKNETIVRKRAIATSPEAQQWAGWKTHLKPAHEPICMARKPFKGSTIDNVLAHGVGALNIDATRIETDETIAEPKRGKGVFKEQECGWNKDDYNGDYKPNEQGRFPSNVIGEVEGYQKFFYCPKVSRKERHIGFENPITNGEMIKQLGATVSGDGQTVSIPGLYDIKIHGLKHEYEKIMGKQNPLAHIPSKTGGMYDVDGTGIMYNAQKNKILKNWEMVKAMGGHYITADGQPILEDGDFGNQAEIPGYGWINLNGIKSIYDDWCKKNNVANNPGNNHPTVKPVELMKYLIKLVTPPNSIVLDPFTGSGSTGMAATELGHEFIGCELDPAYVDIAKRRIEAWNTKETDNTFGELFEYVK